MNPCSILCLRALLGALAVLPLAGRGAPAAKPSPYEQQIGTAVHKLADARPAIRRQAAESLGILRAYSAADTLIAKLEDPAEEVRRSAAIALGWCGGRRHLMPLANRLDDADWSVRQAAAIALGNLTGMDFPFDGLAAEAVRTPQANAWRQWIAELKPGISPASITLNAAGALQTNLAAGCPVTATSAYERSGKPAVLTDGGNDTYWQTKNVPFPQSCTIDLKTPCEIGYVVIHQPQVELGLTEYRLEASLDGTRFETLLAEKKDTGLRLVLNFPVTKLRFLRLVSLGAKKPLYPATISEIEAFTRQPAPDRIERGLRALGSLGGEGSEAAVIAQLAPFLKIKGNVTNAEQKTLVQAGIRALGRLRSPQALPTLVQFLAKPQWARYAADALGELDDPRAIPELVNAFPIYARTLDRKDPKTIPYHDFCGLSPEDRIYTAPYAIAFSLSRLAPQDPEAASHIRPIIPLLVANIPDDYDALMLYEREAWQLIFGDLLDRCQLRSAVCDIAFRQLGIDRPQPKIPELADLETLAKLIKLPTPFASVWLAAFCNQPDQVPGLLKLLDDKNGWVRINAAKALSFLGSQAGADAMLKQLAEAKTEADYGYYGIFQNKDPKAGMDEYNDPTPRWREAFIHCLGRLHATAAVPTIAKILASDRNVMEVQYAAAVALDHLGTPEAIKALHTCEASHPYHTVRMVAREALWKRGITPLPPPVAATPAVPAPAPTTVAATSANPPIIFIKGPLEAPNLYQCDQWRQIYATTDSGPTYRLGCNIYRLDTTAAGQKLTPLTQFADGYVADCETSWDATRIIFCHRGGKTDPWWHLYEMNADGTNQRQLTSGPYHDVQPAYLPDGRIVFSSSRLGARDEYHGYLATGLTVMNPDGSDIHVIGLNLGRDGEPAMLNDGRIGFGRLELFYSRMKTEWNVEAICPDGTRPVVLYGPERRQFWVDYTRQEGVGWGNAGLRHRTLRISQVQPFFNDQILAITQKGLTLVGPDRYTETFIPHDQMMAVTSPFPLDANRILCAAGAKIYPPDKKDPKKTVPSYQHPADLGIYVCDVKTGKLELIYNDPATADFEPRPLVPRTPPMLMAENATARSSQYTGKIVCSDALFAQEQRVRERGRYVRVIEALPCVTRHQTQTSTGLAWKNHGGTQARILGVVPLGPDGSFNLEVPADRFFHLQVLDSDNQVVGNQLIWMTVRPGEVRTCIGCHEQPGTTPVNRSFPVTSKQASIPCLSTEDSMSYRAKLWNKGSISDEEEERMRTVQAVNLMGRN
jgi:HEAT repeat protein